MFHPTISKEPCPLTQFDFGAETKLNFRFCYPAHAPGTRSGSPPPAWKQPTFFERDIGIAIRDVPQNIEARFFAWFAGGIAYAPSG